MKSRPLITQYHCMIQAEQNAHKIKNVNSYKCHKPREYLCRRVFQSLFFATLYGNDSLKSPMLNWRQ